MSQYFDKDFFKLLFGFMTIVCVSLVIILVIKIYQSDLRAKEVPVTNPIINVAKP